MDTSYLYFIYLPLANSCASLSKVAGSDLPGPFGSVEFFGVPPSTPSSRFSPFTGSDGGKGYTSGTVSVSLTLGASGGQSAFFSVLSL
jgi:hypothetical protein